MDREYTFADFKTNMGHWVSIEDGWNIPKIELSVFNPLVPEYYRDRAEKMLNGFIAENGIEKPTERITSVVGIVEACIDPKIEPDKKYSILLFVWVREDIKDWDSKDYMISEAILPTDKHFPGFRECVMTELRNMIF